MKKLIALVMTLICVLCLVACSSSNTDNTTPNTETISNPVMEEPAPLHETEPSTNTTENLNDIIPMVMVKGKLYFDTGRESTADSRCGMMDGEITSTVESSEQPTEDNQSNFGVGYGYQIGVEEGTIEVYINEKWWVCEEVRTT